MSRPKPTILAEATDTKTHKAEQVLASDGIWTVFYDGRPINLRSNPLYAAHSGPKYKKVSFSNPGHAVNLAKKLNKQFKTELFTVVLLNAGEQVYP
jgi:hypothetical protein